MRRTSVFQLRVDGSSSAPVEAMVYSLAIFPDSR